MMIKRSTAFNALAFSVTFLLFTNILWAQSATMRGTVVDALTKDPLPGANIRLMGTSLGAASDYEGKFVIKDVPPGTYTARASYVGYTSHDIKITIAKGRTYDEKFELDPAGVQGRTVTVTAQASGQNEAINQQLSATTIKNVVSIARIQELPDANAAESVARLPGVSLIREGGEGSEVVIRGLSPQYNEITIDGMELPGNVVSNDPNQQSTFVGDRGTNLSMISSSMLGGIEVIKSITPDMDAAVLGGVVNFGLRKAVKGRGDRPTFELSAQDGYKAMKQNFGDYMFVGSYEQRYFGQHLGLFVQASVERRNLSSNELGVSYVLNDKTHGDLGVPDLTSLSLTDVYRLRNRDGFTTVLDYENTHTDIGFMNFLSSSDTRQIPRYESMAPNSNDIFFGATDGHNKLNVIANLLSIKQDISIFHADLRLSHTYSETRNPGDLSFQFWQDYGGLSGNMTKLAPQALASLAQPNDSTALLETIQESGNFSRDRVLTGSLDLQTQVVFSDFLSAKFKFGGMYQHRTRSYEFDYGIGPNIQLGGGNTVAKILAAYPNWQVYGSSVTLTNFVDPSYSFGNFLNGAYSIMYPIDINLMHTIYNLVRVGASAEGFQNNLQASTLYNYHGTEDKSAGYVMGTFDIGTTITFIPGVRYQNLTTSYFAYRGEQIPGGYMFKDTTVTVPHGYWLPMIHLIYKPLSWVQIHLAYTNTLNYPDFNAIVPRYNVMMNAIQYNNYLLKPATSENYDAVISFYNNALGLLTFDGFKKTIKNLIFPSSTYVTDLRPYPDLPQGKNQLYSFSTFINDPNPANVWGLESDWETHFWYLPQPLSFIVFNINYTHIFSKAYYPKSELNFNYNTDGTFTQTVVDTFYSTRMLNQPDDILNMSVGADYKGFSGRVSLLYQNNVFKQPDFWMQNRVISDKYIRWDLSVRQELPWHGIQLFLNLNNITGRNDMDLNQKTGFPVTIQMYGMTGDLGVRVKL